MKIKNKLSLEKENILTLNEVNMENFKGGRMSYEYSSDVCYEIAYEIILSCCDIFLDESAIMRHRVNGSASEYVAYGGCVLSDVQVVCQ